MEAISIVRIKVIMGVLRRTETKTTPDQQMAKFKVNGQIKDSFKMADGHGRSLNRQNCNRRMASLNSILN